MRTTTSERRACGGWSGSLCPAMRRGGSGSAVGARIARSPEVVVEAQHTAASSAWQWAGSRRLICAATSVTSEGGGRAPDRSIEW
eukprot:1296454-Prymnesium_polylepis.2